MSHSHHRHHMPRTLTSFRGLPGEYGNLEVRAESAMAVRFQLTGEFLDLNRNDAQEVIRVLSAWLAEPVSRIVIDNHGGDGAIVIDNDGPDSSHQTEVVIVTKENEPSHVEHQFPSKAEYYPPKRRT